MRRELSVRALRALDAHSAEPDGAGPEPASSSRVQAALAQLRHGRPVLVVDDEDRENEGDLVVAAETMTTETMAFVLRHSSGVVCVGMEGARLDDLDLPQMVPCAEDPMGTAFTVSADAREGVTTGISAADRARTVRALASPGTSPRDLTRPGHVFPLRAREGGVLARPGHTESAVDLCRLAGLQPVGVLAEVMNDDGTMARRPELAAFAAEHGLVMITVADLVGHRRRTELAVLPGGTADLPTSHGRFSATCYVSPLDGAEHLALVRGAVAGAEDVLVRVHSECLTGDALGSRRCDCGEQLTASLAAIATAGRGVVVYLRGHEGRGIGLARKMQAYALQECGLDTVEANEALGLPADDRDYDVAAQILRHLGVGSVRLLTNNPAKSRGLRDSGMRVSGLVPVLVPPHAENIDYLRTKRDRMAHLLGPLPGTAEADVFPVDPVCAP
jgi:3,4-dihydroxy 2-butanone 4-phosphate synthase / GTP cyclohydrolase II